ncbi:DUF1697 domain-containing protein [Flagellimonas meishanensis]|uniref:DUF1697 domain-containing protein n=1 Tax=Flagellimonas meishanensis TaxID=2873264 RepID=UPI001CA65766|nr:DUF1697 domain-containing protein [[Muricauda] meishanensis]
MNTYVALLRGINVSGQKKIRMEDLRATLENVGLHRVKTYIQSGNIVFDSMEAEIKTLEATIYQAILTDFGFEVPNLVLTGNAIHHILESSPFKEETNEKGLYFVLLKEVPNNALVSEFNKLKFDNEDFHVAANCVYLNCRTGYGKAKLNNNLIERKLKVEATTRNLRTMQKLLELTQEVRD